MKYGIIILEAVNIDIETISNKILN